MNFNIFFSQNKLRKIILLFIVIQLMVLFHFLVFNQFFLQDEWHSFGLMLWLKTDYITLKKSLLELVLGDRVGARALSYSLFNLFKLNPLPYGLFAFFLHTTNTYLVFLLARSLTKNSTISLISATFFLTNELGNEAYSWFGTMNGSATAMLFFLLSFLLYLKFLEKKKNTFIIFSFFLLWLSLLFKETAIFAFILYPLIFFVYQKTNSYSLFIKTHALFFIYALVLGLFLLKSVLFIPGDRANYVNSGSSFLPSLFIHTIQYPLEGVVQTFFPNSFIFILSASLTRIINPTITPNTTDFDVMAQNTNAEITLLLILFLLLGTLFYTVIKKRQKISSPIKKTLFISFMFALLSFLPYTVINRSFSYFDSRYYYAASAGGSIFLAALLYELFKTKHKYVKIIIFSIGILYVILHESILLSDFSLLAERTKTRERFLGKVMESVPELPKKTIFYFTGNSPGYYALEELKVPFQSGLGHTLMVMYTTKNKLDPIFFAEQPWTKALDVGFLYDILGQGYREIHGRGFGYYYDKKALNEALNKKLFKKEDIISFYYNSETNTLTQE